MSLVAFFGYQRPHQAASFYSNSQAAWYCAVAAEVDETYFRESHYYYAIKGETR